MPSFTKEQTALIQQLAHAWWENWHWVRLITWIEKEGATGRFRQYSGPKGHIDPDKAKQDAFGRMLNSVLESFHTEARRSGEKAMALSLKAEEMSIPIEIIDNLSWRVARSKRNVPSMERVLLHFPQSKSVQAAIKELRGEIRTADASVSQREVNILAKYAEALKRKPRVPYKPSERVQKYAKLRRHWGRMYK